MHQPDHPDGLVDRVSNPMGAAWFVYDPVQRLKTAHLVDGALARGEEVRDLEEHKRRFLEEDEQVVHELAKVGVHVSSIQDLLNTREPYPEAIPTLIRMLKKVSYLPVKEVLARDLTCKEAKGKAEIALLEEFMKTLPDDDSDADSFRWAVGNALEILGSKSNSGPLLDAIQDRRGGSARGMLALAAGKTRDPTFIPVLLEMLSTITQISPLSIT